MVVRGFFWINRSISYYASCGSECWICFLQLLTYWIPNILGLCACVKLCLVCFWVSSLGLGTMHFPTMLPWKLKCESSQSNSNTILHGFRFERLGVGGIIILQDLVHTVPGTYSSLQSFGEWAFAPTEPWKLLGFSPSLPHSQSCFSGVEDLTFPVAFCLLNSSSSQQPAIYRWNYSYCRTSSWHFIGKSLNMDCI